MVGWLLQKTSVSLFCGNSLWQFSLAELPTPEVGQKENAPWGGFRPPAQTPPTGDLWPSWHKLGGRAPGASGLGPSPDASGLRPGPDALAIN